MDLGGCGSSRNCNSLFCFFLTLFFKPLLKIKRGLNYHYKIKLQQALFPYLKTYIPF